MLNNLITLKELSIQLGKPEKTIRTWKQRGEIPAFCFRTIGHTVFVLLDKFEAWIENPTTNI